MENGNQQYALEHFASVWARVGGSPPESASPGLSPSEPLAVLIGAEAERIAHCTALAGRIGGSMGQSLARIAREKRARLHRLELELFLCSGMFRRQMPQPPRTGKGILTELQAAYRAEQALQRQYQFAQAAAPEPSLRQLYAACETAELRYAEILRCIIGRMLGIL